MENGDKVYQQIVSHLERLNKNMDCVLDKVARHDVQLKIVMGLLMAVVTAVIVGTVAGGH